MLCVEGRGHAEESWADKGSAVVWGVPVLAGKDACPPPTMGDRCKTGEEGSGSVGVTDRTQPTGRAAAGPRSPHSPGVTAPLSSTGRHKALAKQGGEAGSAGKVGVASGKRPDAKAGAPAREDAITEATGKTTAGSPISHSPGESASASTTSRRAALAEQGDWAGPAEAGGDASGGQPDAGAGAPATEDTIAGATGRTEADGATPHSPDGSTPLTSQRQHAALTGRGGETSPPETHGTASGEQPDAVHGAPMTDDSKSSSRSGGKRAGPPVDGDRRRARSGRSGSR